MKIKLLFLSFTILVIVACSRSKEEIPLAKVGNNTLYYSDLALEMPSGIAPEDSLAILNNLVQAWVMDELVANEAEDFLDKKEKDFSKQIENYRKSLLIYEFEKKWIISKLDTNISNKEVETYYQSNTSEFELKTSIVKLKFVKLAINQKVAIKEQLKRLLFSDRKADDALLQKLCDENAENYYLDDTVWLLYDDIVKEIPISDKLNDENSVNGKKMELSDNQYNYFVVIKEMKIKDEVSPITFESDNIKKIILQKRKYILLDSLHNSIKSKATSSGTYTIY